MIEIINNRYEFVFLFDVENGNPNGDPDAGNMPRIDPETGRGLVTDVCIKRKVRNYVQLTRDDVEGYNIYITEGAILNEQHMKAYKAQTPEFSPEPKKLPKDAESAAAITAFMCRNFFDIRTFGAVMTTEVNCGQVRGPVQFGFARSIDPIIPQELVITRVAVTKTTDAQNKDREMGRKYIVPYGLYRMEGFISAPLARKTGFHEEDLKLLWEALLSMFDHDHSSSRGIMATRKLVVFKHESAFGNAPASSLIDRVKVERDAADRAPRMFNDYSVVIDRTDIPTGVQILEML